MQTPVVKFFETPIPEEIYLQSNRSKHSYLVEAVKSLPLIGHIEVEFSNKLDARKAQTSIVKWDKASPDQIGFKVITRMTPVDGNKDGAWTLYVQRRPAE